MILKGWKAIAEHVSSAVATVIRWKSRGLPVHRCGPHERGCVVGYSEEIDAWLRSSSLWAHDGLNQRSVMARRAAVARFQRKRRREEKVRILEHLLHFQEKIQIILDLCAEGEFSKERAARASILLAQLQREFESEGKATERSRTRDVHGPEGRRLWSCNLRCSRTLEM